VQQRNDSVEFKKHEFGRLIEELRVKRGLSRTRFAARIGINSTYLAQIEEGNRIPTDEMIRNFAKYFNVDEDKLFEIVGRVPLVAREELENQTLLQNVLKEIAKLKISEEKKQDIYKEFFRIVQSIA
jgi:transcriptional regulator with XRE-family HTH domain